ncbi:hypothetical protein [Rhizobium laguerreae]|uniref:hypothetical protein n=1 Tax=Rhizobium laguerreae TaxID=1076926 RepID=UPI001C92339F|nr:hypothetical protein [Rhizobium laguerreae]MBY3038919.1 hypothetical protein [Rhizobium laguerreae]
MANQQQTVAMRNIRHMHAVVVLWEGENVYEMGVMMSWVQSTLESFTNWQIFIAGTASLCSVFAFIYVGLATYREEREKITLYDYLLDAYILDGVDPTTLAIHKFTDFPSDTTRILSNIDAIGRNRMFGRLFHGLRATEYIRLNADPTGNLLAEALFRFNWKLNKAGLDKTRKAA